MAKPGSRDQEHMFIWKGKVWSSKYSLLSIVNVRVKQTAEVIAHACGLAFCVSQQGAASLRIVSLVTLSTENISYPTAHVLDLDVTETHARRLHERVLFSAASLFVFTLVPTNTAPVSACLLSSLKGDDR